MCLDAIFFLLYNCACFVGNFNLISFLVAATSKFHSKIYTLIRSILKKKKNLQQKKFKKEKVHQLCSLNSLHPTCLITFLSVKCLLWSYLLFNILVLINLLNVKENIFLKKKILQRILCKGWLIKYGFIKSLWYDPWKRSLFLWFFQSLFWFRNQFNLPPSWFVSSIIFFNLYTPPFT